MIIAKALKMALVGPARVMIRSGQFPSEMLMRAPLCRRKNEQRSELLTPPTLTPKKQRWVHNPARFYVKQTGFPAGDESSLGSAPGSHLSLLSFLPSPAYTSQHASRPRLPSAAGAAGTALPANSF